MVRILTAANPMEAELSRGYLAGAGIAAEVRGAHLFFIRGAVPLAEDTLPSVWVPEHEEPSARRLLAHAAARARLKAVESAPPTSPE